jgi:penicillin-binding protein 1A
MTLRDALTNSVNIVSVKLIIDVGFDPVIKLAHLMGIKSQLVPAYSLALGTSEVNLLELANAYSTLAATGDYTEAHGIRRILNRKGDVLYQSGFKSKRVIDKNTVAIMTWLMQNVVNSGTGRAAQIDRPVAGKTGTSEEARDLWFIGFIPQLVAGVWLGNDENTPTWSYSSTAASVWHDFMTVAVKGMSVKDFPPLPNLEGRKGSIKAKPVKPAHAYTTSEPSNSNYDYQQSSPAKSSEPSRSSGYSQSAPSNSSPPEPAPSEAPSEAPPPASEPVPPPPVNTAPPDLPPAEPAPPASSGSSPPQSGN